MMLNCPIDGTKMDKIVAGDVELDRCPQCEGIWCDPTELETIRERGVVVDELPSISEKQRRNPPGEVRMRCPRCYKGGRNEGRLMRQNCMYGQPIFIDRCLDCQGVWLDAGELAAIVEVRKTVKRKLGNEGGVFSLLSFVRGLID